MAQKVRQNDRKISKIDKVEKESETLFLRCKQNVSIFNLHLSYTNNFLRSTSIDSNEI